MREAILPHCSVANLPPDLALPVLPKSLLHFNERADDPNASVEELADILSRDSGLSMSLLRRANSPAAGLRRDITSVQEALTVMGIHATQSLLVAFALQKTMKANSTKLINMQSFWNVNLERALMAKKMAIRIRVDPELAYTAGMLQDFMLPSLTNELTTEYLDFTERRVEAKSLAEFEKERFGFDHGEVAATVMWGWKLPDKLICTVALHHQLERVQHDQQLERSPALPIAATALLPDPMRQESDALNRLMRLDSEYAWLDLLKIAKEAQEDFEMIEPNATNHFPLFSTLRRLQPCN